MIHTSLSLTRIYLAGYLAEFKAHAGPAVQFRR